MLDALVPPDSALALAAEAATPRFGVALDGPSDGADSLLCWPSTLNSGFEDIIAKLELRSGFGKATTVLFELDGFEAEGKQKLIG